MRYVPDVQKGKHDEGISAESIIISLARLDAFFVTLLSGHSDDGQDTVAGHCQKMYQKALAHAFPKAYRLIIGKVPQFVKVQAPTDLESSSVWMAKEEAGCSESFGQGDNVAVFIPSIQCHLKADSSE